MGNANTVISKERKKFASICFGKKPRRLSPFPMGKWNHISRSKALSWEPGRLRIFIKIAERDVKWETGVLTWNSTPWKMEIRDFLCSSQIASYILDIFPLQTGICFLVKNFQITFFQWEQITWTFFTRQLQTGSVLDIYTGFYSIFSKEFLKKKRRNMRNM